MTVQRLRATVERHGHHLVDMSPIFIIRIGAETTPNDPQGRASRGHLGTGVDASVRSRDRSAASRFVSPPTFERVDDLDTDVAVVDRGDP
jgi:hypothetical protein